LLAGKSEDRDWEKSIKVLHNESMNQQQVWRPALIIARTGNHPESRSTLLDTGTTLNATKTGKAIPSLLYLQQKKLTS
jgi:hypothetical protein